MDIVLVPSSLVPSPSDRPVWHHSLYPLVESNLQASLPSGESWLASLEVWGEENGDRVDVLWSDERQHFSVRARVDARARDSSFLKALERLAVAIGGSYFLLDGRPVGHTAVSLARAIVESDASHFVTDPDRFFEDLSS